MDNDEFWRKVWLAENEPETYRLEKECRQWFRIAMSNPFDPWVDKALREYFGLTEHEADEIMLGVTEKYLASRKSERIM